MTCDGTGQRGFLGAIDSVLRVFENPQSMQHCFTNCSNEVYQVFSLGRLVVLVTRRKSMPFPDSSFARRQQLQHRPRGFEHRCGAAIEIFATNTGQKLFRASTGANSHRSSRARLCEFLSRSELLGH